MERSLSFRLRPAEEQQLFVHTVRYKKLEVPGFAAVRHQSVLAANTKRSVKRGVFSRMVRLERNPPLTLQDPKVRSVRPATVDLDSASEMPWMWDGGGQMAIDVATRARMEHARQAASLALLLHTPLDP